MKLQKFRWSNVYESSEEELTEFLAARQIVAERWSVEPFDALPKPAAESVTLWCAEGATSLRIEGATISLQVGDAIHIPANVAYELAAGMSGCVCYESAR